MKKKQACQMIAGLVSICAVVSIISTVQSFLLVHESGGDVPLGMVLLTAMTILCTVLIWRGVRNMED